MPATALDFSELRHKLAGAEKSGYGLALSLKA